MSSDFLKQDLISLISPSLLFGSVPIFLIDYIYEKRSLDKTFYDSMIMGGSIFIT